MSKLIDLTGQRFGRLVVIERAGNKRREALWKCRCDCGTFKEVTSYNLRKGMTQSCGCLRKETTSEMFRGNKTCMTHGRYGTRLYRIWAGMKHRCSPSCSKREFDSYYGKGIRVCNEWNDFAVFAEWALKSGYSDELSIDRINNDGNYEPENCRWATIETQINNRSNSKYVTYRGETLTVAQWERKIGMNRGSLRGFLERGKTIEEIMKERGL